MVKFEDLTGTVMSVIIVVLMIAVVLIPVMTDALKDIEGYDTVITVLKLVPLFLAIAVIWLVMKMFVNTKN